MKTSLLTFVLALLFLLSPAGAQTPLPVKIGPDDPLILYSGRRDDAAKGEVLFGYSGARVRLAFEGEGVGMWMGSQKANWVNVYVDGKRVSKTKIEGPDGYYELASGLAPGTHEVEVVKATEGNVGPVIFKGFALPAAAKALAWPKKEDRKIEFIGDSITCGYGIEVNDPKLHFSPETENFSDGFAGLTARALGADYLVVARSGIGILRNYNGPFDGSPDNMPRIYPGTLFGKDTPVWDHTRFVPDVVCINLGTNDFSTKGVNEEKYQSNYIEFVKMLEGRYPAARIVLLMGPMQNSPKLKEILQKVAAEINAGGAEKVTVFEMSKQGGQGFGADYHPSQAQGKINAQELTEYLSKLMQWPVL